MEVGEFIENVVKPSIKLYGFEFDRLGENDSGAIVMYLKGFDVGFSVQGMYDQYKKGISIGFVLKDGLGK